MNKGATLVATALLLICSTALGKEPVELRMVPLDSFMQAATVSETTISIPVPVQYEAAKLEQAPIGYSYWMRPEDVPGVVQSGDLPADSGYMYGKLSLDAGYDEERDLFIGVEDLAHTEQAKMRFSDLSMERIRVGDRAVLILSMRDKRTRNYVLAAYIAADAHNVIYVAYRPAENSKKLGDCVWDALKQELNRAGEVLESVAN